MPGSGNRLTKLTAAMVLGLIASFAAVDFAEARRAGGAVLVAVVRVHIKRLHRRALHQTMQRLWNVR